MFVQFRVAEEFKVNLELVRIPHRPMVEQNVLGIAERFAPVMKTHAQVMECHISLSPFHPAFVLVVLILAILH